MGEDQNTNHFFRASSVQGVEVKKMEGALKLALARAGVEGNWNNEFQLTRLFSTLRAVSISDSTIP